MDVSMTLTPVRWSKRLKGKSCPQLIQFSDGMRYIVKFKNNPQGTKQLVNDYIASRLAQYLSLPVPECTQIAIDQPFIDKIPEWENYQFSPGVQFASLYIKKAKKIREHFPPVTSVVNADVLPGIIVFDHWLSNDDRNRNNLLLERQEPDLYRVVMIDHGNCFPGGINWTLDSLEGQPNPIKLRPVHKWILSMMEDSNKLFEFIYAVHRLPVNLLYETIQSLPDDWNISTYEKEALLIHLLRGRQVLEDLVYKAVKYYF